MKLKMLASFAGSDFALSPGEVTERFTPNEGWRLVEAGFAVPVDEQPIEKAVKKTPAREKRG